MNGFSEAAAVIICQSNTKVGLTVGEYSYSNLQQLGLGGTAVSSIQVAKDYQAIIYAGDNHTGDSKVITGETCEENISLKNCKCPLKLGSIRVLASVILEPDARDRQAVEDAVTSWWPQSMVNRESRLSWWREARFGCFIHWGAYSLTGGRWKGEKSHGYAEHLMRAKKITLEEYKDIFIDKFNPEEFDAEEWVKLIKAAGMKYLVITAKHHDGFAIYPSEAYPFDIRMTPFKRDPLEELREACRRHGIKYGFYYSHAFDWEHPDAPGNDWEYTNPGGDLKLYEGPGKLWFAEHPDLLPRVSEYYVSQKSIPQIIELIKKYEPDILWFDTPHKLPLSENLRILKAIRETDDRVVVNGRLARGWGFDTFSDYVNTADRALEIFPCEGDWETIPTTNESYGYSMDDHSHKPASVFIQLLAKSAARGGNVLMNLGPMGNGKIDERDIPILQEVGAWLDINGESIYGTQRTPLDVQCWGESTRKGNQLYLHVFHWPKDGELVIGGLKNHIRKAWLLSDPDKKPLGTKRINYYDWAVRLPKDAPDKNDSVVVVEIDGEAMVHPGKLLSEKNTNILRAFDAEVSPGIGYGDGKKGNDYIFGWKSINQLVKWKIRLYHATAFKLVMKYSTASPENAGIYRIYVGDQTIENRVEPTSNPKEISKAEHDVTIAAGEHDVMIMPVGIDGEELMRLYSVMLVPIASHDMQGEAFVESDNTDVGG